MNADLTKCLGCKHWCPPNEQSRGLDWCGKFKGSTAWARAQAPFGQPQDCGPDAVAFEAKK